MRWVFAVWGFLGGLVFSLHVAAATTAAVGGSGYFGEPDGFHVILQIVLSLFSTLVVYFGIRMTWLLRNPISPTEMQISGMEVARPQMLNPPTQVHFAEARLSPSREH